MTRKQLAYRLYLQTSHWATLRASVMDRDKGLCVRCGLPATTAHHKVYRLGWSF